MVSGPDAKTNLPDGGEILTVTLLKQDRDLATFVHHVLGEVVEKCKQRKFEKRLRGEPRDCGKSTFVFEIIEAAHVFCNISFSDSLSSPDWYRYVKNCQTRHITCLYK